MRRILIILFLMMLIGTASAVSTLYLMPLNASEPMPNAKQSADTIHRDVATSRATYLVPGVMSEKVSTIQAIQTTAESTVAEAGVTHYTHYGTWISNPLNAQWVNGTVTVALVMAEGNIAVNANPRLKIYKWYANDTKGEELRTIANSATEAPAAYPSTPVTYFNAVALTSTYFEDDDRIAVEIESYDNNAATTARLHGIRYGSISGGYMSYVRFSQNLTYLPPKPVVVWEGPRDISIALGSSLWPAATLASETKKNLDLVSFPYNITYGLTQTRLQKYRCDIDICWVWLEASRGGLEIATDSPIGISPPPFESIISVTPNSIKNEDNIVLKENTTLAMEQILQRYIDSRPLGKSTVGTKK